jgi:hypothetical protein
MTLKLLGKYRRLLGSGKTVPERAGSGPCIGRVLVR